MHSTAWRRGSLVDAVLSDRRRRLLGGVDQRPAIDLGGWIADDYMETWRVRLESDVAVAAESHPENLHRTLPSGQRCHRDHGHPRVRSTVSRVGSGRVKTFVTYGGSGRVNKQASD